MAKKDNASPLIHRIRAQDKTGEWAQYFISMDAKKEPAFLKAVKSKGDIDLKKYGTVVASFYGDNPPDDVKRLLLEKYGYRV